VNIDIFSIEDVKRVSLSLESFHLSKNFFLKKLYIWIRFSSKKDFFEKRFFSGKEMSFVKDFYLENTYDVEDRFIFEKKLS